MDEGEDQEQDQKFILSIMERNSFQIFDEVSRASPESDLCLPFILNLKVMGPKRDKSAILPIR